MLKRRKTISFEKGKAIISGKVNALSKEKIRVNKANGRTLAEPVYIPFPYPFFRRSGYDGYAIRADDDQNYPITLDVVKQIACGETYEKPLAKGETVRIMTGAKVPENGAKIIMLEQSKESSPNTVTLLNTQKKSNITEVGAEFQKGDLLFEKGTILNPGALSLLQAFGINEINVIRKPKIAILSTGSELVRAGEKLPEGKIYNSNEILLQGLVEESGAIVKIVEQLPDNYNKILQSLKKAASEVDLILTTGGVSVGDYDFMAEIATNEAELLFNKVEMRPGSPTTAMIYKDTLAIGLSGNPGACFTAFYLFIEPALKKMQGKSSAVKRLTAIMATDYLKNNGYDRFLRGSYCYKKGVCYVRPAGSDTSSALGNLHLSTCLIMIPRGRVGKKEGEGVESWLLPCKS